MEKKIIKIISVFLILLAVPICAYADENETDIQVDENNKEEIIDAAGDLAGTVTINHDGSPQYGETIIANTSAVTNNTGTFSYQWTRNGSDISGADGVDYIIGQADIGADIGVKVTSSAEAGTLSSVTVQPAKADRAAPSKPTLQSSDHYSVTLNVVAGCEYKITGRDFVSSNVFTDLKSNNDYYFYQRYTETATHNASPSSKGLYVTTEYITLSNTTCDISTLNSGDGVKVSGNVTLTGAQSIIVTCSAGTTLTLSNVRINVASLSGECAICFEGSGNKLILKGTNVVYSGSTRAGIEAKGSLSISGSGSMYSKGGSNGAGIGSGSNKNASSISISGGTITAIGGNNAAGIGGGNQGNGSSVNISGGIIYAIGSSGDDIGGGKNASSGSLNISGTSAVFLKNNSAPAASSGTHQLYSNETISGGKAYTYSVPSVFSEGSTAYAYINYCTVTFNTNGGSTQASQQVVAGKRIDAPDDPTKNGLRFGGWYLDSSFEDEFDVEDDKVTSDLTLYTKWEAEVTINASEGGSVSPNGKIMVLEGENITIECTPDENYYVGEVVSKEGHIVTDNENKSYTIKNITESDTIDIVFESNVLLGEVTIKHDGLPEFGDELEADIKGITNIPEGAVITYQWTRNGVDINGADKAKYMVVKDDIRHKIAVKVSCTLKEGFVVSTDTRMIEKAKKPAPSSPILVDKNTDTITLFLIEGCEYMMEGFEWQESNIFTNLQPETEYTFYQRYQETETHVKSNSSFSLKVSTRGFSITEIEFMLDDLRMCKGDVDNLTSVMQYSINPSKVENEEVVWTSSNPDVAFIDSTNGTITAVMEGKTIITITAADTTNGTIVDTCILQVFDPEPEDSDAYLGAFSGRLTDNRGNKLAGYTITLYSNPISLRTTEDGEFYIDIIPYTSHILVVEDADSREIGRFIINWSLGDSNRASIDSDSNVINIIYTDLTEAVNIPIEVNKDFDNISVKKVEGISFIGEDGVVEVQKQSKKLYVLIMMGIIAACIIGVGYILYIGRIQRDEYCDEPIEQGQFEQKMLDNSTVDNNNNSRD